ncbi:MAG TPA: CheR family methyltransferase [Candidatus Ozemobacteraceae bacterium]
MAFSFFFRDLPTLDTAARNMVAQTMGCTRIRVWVAGSAKGQEVYTLAFLLAEQMGYFSFQNLRIEATDIEAEFGEIILQGIYHKTDLERIPQMYFDKYFKPADKPDHFQVIEPVRRRVQFTHHDLLSLKPIGEGFNLIVCKNVLLHFQPQERVDVFQMFHATLASEGILANENTQKLPPEIVPLFEQLSGDTQVYRKVSRAA